ncbi:MAG: hypothetical protein J0H41_00435 [Rhizobiales bacterium]|nr:hypothetical protein [Hyphomicrobiales bacterium]
MPFLLLVGLSAILALVGVAAAWLGVDDRNPGLLGGGVVALGLAGLLMGLAMLVREIRAFRTAMTDAFMEWSLARGPSGFGPAAAATSVASPAAEPIGDAALAAVAAGLAEQTRRAGVEKSNGETAQAELPPLYPDKPAEPEITVPSPRSVFIEAGLKGKPPIEEARADDSTPIRPPSVESLLRPQARRFSENRARLSPLFRPGSLDEQPATGAVAASETAPEKPAASAETVAPPTPPDIDTILNEIISRRDRQHQKPSERDAEPEPELRRAGPAAPEPAEGEPAVAALAEATDELKRAEPAPTETNLTPPPPVVAVAEVEAESQVEIVAEAVAPPSPASDRADDSTLMREPAESPEAESVEAETGQESSAIAAPSAGASVEPPAADESLREEPQPESPAADEVPVDAEASEAVTRKMVRSFSSGPNRYTMYEDGSIEAETPTGRLSFASFDDLRRYIDERMTQRSAGA